MAHSETCAIFPDQTISFSIIVFTQFLNNKYETLLSLVLMDTL